jgi:hypothetical protein
MMDKLSQWQQDQQNQQKAEKQKQTQADNFDSGGGSYDPDNSRSTKDENNYIKGYLHSEQSNSENKVFLESILGKVRNTKKTWLN